jgi:hypothetical protein
MRVTRSRTTSQAAAHRAMPVMGAMLVMAVMLIILAAAPAALAAQSGPESRMPPALLQAQAETSLIYARPVGEFADHVRRGFGLAIGVTVPLWQDSPLSIRWEGGGINYGSETREVCISATVGCRIRLDLRTSNDIIFTGLGPQLSLPYGPVRPYVGGTVGVTYFATSSSLKGLGDHHSFAQTTNHDDLIVAYGASGGVRVALPTRRVPVLLNVGGRYHANGRAEYLTKGDITDRPDGSIVISPRRSEANLVSWYAGISIGVPRPAGQ